MGIPSSKDVAIRLLILKYQVVHALALPPQDAIGGLNESDREQITRAFKERADQFTASMKGNGLWNQMTKEEKEFGVSTPFNVDWQQHLNAMWSMESVAVLTWAIGLADFPRFDTQTDGTLLEKIPYGDVKRFTGSATLIPTEVIERKRSLAELWHWRVRTRKLIQDGYQFEPEDDTRTLDDIVRNAAKRAFDNGDLDETIEGDFPYRGKAFRSLTEDEYVEARSIIMERHKALNWLCGYARGNHWDRTPTDT